MGSNEQEDPLQEQRQVAPARLKLNPAHVIALAGAALCDPRSVRKWMRGENVRATVRERLDRAARALGLPLAGGTP